MENTETHNRLLGPGEHIAEMQIKFENTTEMYLRLPT